MKTFSLWVAVAFVFLNSLRADGLDVFLRQRDKIVAPAEFDAAKHIGVSCKATHLSTLTGIARKSVRCLKLDFGAAPVTPEVLGALEECRELETLMILRLNVQSGDVGGILKAVPSLKALGFLQGSLAGLEWPEHETHLREVLLSASDLRSLPVNLARSDCVETLTVSDSALVELVLDLTGMQKLARVSFTNCQIERVVDSFRLPKSVEFLRLSFNRLSSVPDSIKTLERLRDLDLMGNRVTAVPDWLAELWLTTPVEVNLSENQIRLIPDFVWENGGRINLARNLFSTPEK
jgi:Leucine-rich repeat (LRR) protein